MPLTKVSMRAGKPTSYKEAVLDGLYAAMREEFAVPEGDYFMTISDHDEASFRYSATYLGIERSDDLIIVQITCNDTRSVDQKKALYRSIVGKLGRAPGVRPQDVFVNIVEGGKANWSFGNGVAQYA